MRFIAINYESFPEDLHIFRNHIASMPTAAQELYIEEYPAPCYAVAGSYDWSFNSSYVHRSLHSTEKNGFLSQKCKRR